MKHKLTKAAIEKLETMEFEYHSTYESCLELGDALHDHWLNSNKFKVFEPIAEKLPKPVLRSVEDLKALEGWEISKHNEDYWNPIMIGSHVGLNKLSIFSIRQIDMPENEYLVADCIEQEIQSRGKIYSSPLVDVIDIEQEIEVGDLVKFEARTDSPEYFIVEGIHGVDFVKGTTIYHGGYCELIRKASEITAQDREKYLGEKQEVEEFDLGEKGEQLLANMANELEAKVREIFKKVLKEEAGE